MGKVVVRPPLMAGGKQEVWNLKTNNSRCTGLEGCALGGTEGYQGSSR